MEAPSNERITNPILTLTHDHLNFDINLINQGFSHIIGVDEVGRGCIAGPIVAGAVILDFEKVANELQNPKSDIFYIKDSKKVTPKRREKLSSFIPTLTNFQAVRQIEANVIDERGIQYANKQVMLDAIFDVVSQIEGEKKIAVITDYVDLSKDLDAVGVKCFPIIHGDTASLTISAASIIAKVYRDSLMRGEIHTKYPQYGFDKHVGYGTKAHTDAITIHGLCPEHRRTFCKNYI